MPCDTGLITYDVKTLQKLLERSARCTHFLHGCDWKGPVRVVDICYGLLPSGDDSS